MMYTGLHMPRWIRSGIKPNHRGSRLDKLVYGADTETVHGKPNSMQFYSEDVACDEIIFCDGRNALRKFLAWCAKRRPKVLHVVYVHNLAFDLIEFLWGRHENLIDNNGEFDFTAHGWRVMGLYGTPTFCTLTMGHDRRIVIVDSFSFYRGSLASASALYCPDLPKLARPQGLGDIRFTAKHDGFVAYAMRDAVVTYHVGRAIEELHREFDLTQCISIADMAARIFRHHYLLYTIPQPTLDIVHAALASYHGGKNNITASAGRYVGVTGIDISSAYPDAMQHMPAFADARLYKRFRARRGKRIRVSHVPPFGVYRCSGTLRDCRWPVLFTEDFKPMRGTFNDTWIQGQEVNEALRSGECTLTNIAGFYYDEEKDGQAPALRNFCNDFYRRKENEPNKVRRTGYKFILNAVSGKFIQTRKRAITCYVDIDSRTLSNASELVAGGMFHPFIASAITAHTRARMHRLEHYWEAIHTATDGLFTRRNVVQGTRQVDRDILPCREKVLGGLSIDFQGELLLVRNKCYIGYTNGQRVKWALHGFQGQVEDLERLVNTGARSYIVNKANRLKESIKRGLTPNDFTERTFTLKVGPIEAQRAQ